MPGFGSLAPDDPAENELLNSYRDPMTGLPVGSLGHFSARSRGPGWMMEPDLLSSQMGTLPPGVTLNDTGQYVDQETAKPLKVVPRPAMLPYTQTPEGGQWVKPKVVDIAGSLMGSPASSGTAFGLPGRFLANKRVSLPSQPEEPPPRRPAAMSIKGASETPEAEMPPSEAAKPVEAPPARELPDVGPPLIPSGPEISRGTKAAEALWKYWTENAAIKRLGDPNVDPTDKAMELAMGFSGGGLGTKAKALRPIAEDVAAVPAHKPGTLAEQSAIDTSSWPNAPYVRDAQRVYKPGIYKNPRVIAAEANAMVAPEHPALKQLFGVTRQDLYDISQQGTRQGNVAPNIWQPKNPVGSYAAENIMNPANAQRMIDTLTEARKYPGLERGMLPWYVMDPAYQRLEQLVGPQRAVAEYNKFNSMMTPFSASSDVMKEINRGTAARMMAEQGRLPDFVKYGGMPVEQRGADFPPEMADVIPHLRHAPTHTGPAVRWAQTGAHGYGQDTVKIPLYTQASGVPQTGFQTAWPVPDAHFTRAVGMSDVRKNAMPGDYMGGSEYRTFAPWYRQNVTQPLGIEAVPGQALTWGTYAPQTGVKTPIGAGKLELLAQRIWERAQKLGIDPRQLRDDVLMGKGHASWLLPTMGAGGLAGAGFGSMIPSEERQ